MKSFLKNNRYYLYLLFIPIYLVAFFATEYVINNEYSYWVSYLPIDDVVPFIDWFVVFYVLWYPFLIGVGVLLLIKDKRAYERYALMIITGFSASIIFFWIFPNGQNLRPSSFEDDNIFTRMIGLLYSSDTHTNVLPSMHVYGSLVGMLAIIDSDKVKNFWIIFATCALGLLISASTVFIKQHSVLDGIASIVMLLPLYFVVYFKRIFSRKQSIFEKTNVIAATEELDVNTTGEDLSTSL